MTIQPEDTNTVTSDDQMLGLVGTKTSTEEQLSSFDKFAVWYMSRFNNPYW